MTELSRSVRVDGISCSEVPIWKPVRGIEVSYSNLWPIIAVDTILALANRHTHYQHHPPPWHFSCQNQWQFWRWLLQGGPQAQGWQGNAQPAYLLSPFQNGTLQQHSVAMTLPGKKKGISRAKLFLPHMCLCVIMRIRTRIFYGGTLLTNWFVSTTLQVITFPLRKSMCSI